MLVWQEKNICSIAGAVTSLGTRFRVMTCGYTLYQMRHSWKDLAVHAGIGAELRERVMGHKLLGRASLLQRMVQVFRWRKGWILCC